MAKAFFAIGMIGVLALSACTPKPAPTLELPTATVVPPTQTKAPTTPTQRPPTSTPLTQGRTLLVTSPADSGPGTLRQALEDAQSSDTITFDPAVFPPDAPVTISLASGLPEITQCNLTIDASDAGVILEGSNLNRGEGGHGLSISSDRNTIRGLQIVGFPDAGISLYGGAQYNLIGGDQGVGDAKLGQGNLISGNGNFGIGLWDATTSHNTIAGNYIGISLDGTSVWGHTRDGIHSNGATQNLITDNVIGGNESAGVYLCCVLEGRNTVTANLIGVGPSGNPLGNGLEGILIDRTSHNEVGPGNTVAHNLGDGIAFWEDSPYNTVTQNSIHNNGGMAIQLSYPDILAPSVPLLLDFDLQAGTVAGLTCAGCTVEIFSDAEDEAAIYEGRTSADETGNFTFDMGGPLAGPLLTAIAIDPKGGTSQLAPHTSGPGQTTVLQAGNERPRVELRTKSLAELEGNRIGDVFDEVSLARYPLPCPLPQEDWSFTHVVDMGFTWVRLSVDRLEWWEGGNMASNRSMGVYASPDINLCQDQVISLLAENGVTILHTIVYWDEELHSQRIPDYRNEAEVQGYLDYARLLVRHFKDRIQYFGILNEAMLYVDLPTYLNLIHRAVPVIREEYPEAKIVVGGTANLADPGSQSYLFGILTSDVMPLIDVIELHPMYGASPQFEDVRQYYYDYPAIIGEIRRVAAEHGFVGEIMATELTWATDENPDPASPLRYSVPQVAKYYARGIVLHRGLDMWAALGGPYWMPPVAKVVHNLTTILDGAEPESLDVQIESQASNIVSYTFSLPDGELLVALWTDGAALDHDPGMPATVTFPGNSARKVIGIDVLYGFEQQPVTEMVGGDLVIRDLLVKDYPIILRLTDQ